ncbi:hypothetical protein LUZ60_011051 [Juncus effusus]|nr:hypothetical protein LUZ60_011051 [Juncus effusus]
MAYRRKQTMTRSATFVEDHRKAREMPADGQESSTSSLAAQAIRASALHRESSLSSAYGDSAFNASSDRRRIDHPQVQEINKIEYTSIKGLNDNQITNSEGKNGFWGVLARKAKHMLDENGNDENSQTIDSTNLSQPSQSRWSYERLKKQENPAFQKGSDALKDIGGKIRKSLEEGLTMVENRTADIIQETKKLQIRRKNSQNNLDQIQIQIGQSEQENQLKASRDVANAMAAKAKLLLRELKTVKADLAFAKLRCSQLEEENKVLREGRQKGGPTNEDDDLIRLQLETLLAEKGRLAHENSVYARENRFLREIVDFHQFNTHDVVSLDGEFEEDNDDFALDIPPHLQDHPVNNKTPTIQKQNSDVNVVNNVEEMESPVEEKEVKSSSSPVQGNPSSSPVQPA